MYCTCERIFVRMGDWFSTRGLPFRDGTTSPTMSRMATPLTSRRRTSIDSRCLACASPSTTRTTCARRPVWLFWQVLWASKTHEHTARVSGAYKYETKLFWKQIKSHRITEIEMLWDMELFRLQKVKWTHSGSLHPVALCLMNDFAQCQRSRFIPSLLILYTLQELYPYLFSNRLLFAPNSVADEKGYQNK